MYMCTYVYMYECMCVCVFMHVCVYVCMYTYSSSIHVCILLEYIYSKQKTFPDTKISPYILSYILSLRHKHNLTVILEGQKKLGDQPK